MLKTSAILLMSIIILTSCKDMFPTKFIIEKDNQYYPFSIYGTVQIYSQNGYTAARNAEVYISYENGSKDVDTDGSGFYKFTFPAGFTKEFRYVQVRTKPNNTITITDKVDIYESIYMDTEVNFLYALNDPLNVKADVTEIKQQEYFTLSWDNISPVGYEIKYGTSSNYSSMSTIYKNYGKNYITLQAPSISYYSDYYYYRVSALKDTEGKTSSDFKTETFKLKVLR